MCECIHASVTTLLRLDVDTLSFKGQGRYKKTNGYEPAMNKFRWKLKIGS